MKKSYDSLLGITKIVATIMAVVALTTQAAVVNLSPSATGFGTTPSVTLDQGTAAGIADGTLFDWGAGAALSPRLFSPSTNLQPYMTWSSAQSIRTVRVWKDATAAGFDRIVVDRLSGSDPTVEGDWTTVTDTGTGLSAVFVDLDLGTTISTSGLRVRAFKTAGDIAVGEVATFAPYIHGGTLTQNRVIPTSTAASSTGFGRVTGNAQDGWLVEPYTSWLSDTQAANPGTDFTYDMFFSTPTSLDSAAVTWFPQPGFGALPSAWELLADTGAGLQSLGTYSASGSRLQYYLNFTPLVNVQQLRLRVAEANVAGGLGISLFEFEAFDTLSTPEPSTLLLLAVGGLVLFRRKRNG